MTQLRRAFFDRKTRTISREEHEQYTAPHACCERVMASVEAWAKKAESVLAESEDPNERDDAERVLDAIKGLRKEILRAPQNKFLLIEHAIHLGATVTEAHTLKFETPYLTGKKIRDRAPAGGGHNRISVEVTTQWQSEANRIWTANPRLSKNDVSKSIAKTFGASHITVRRKIRKSD